MLRGSLQLAFERAKHESKDLDLRNAALRACTLAHNIYPDVRPYIAIAAVQSQLLEADASSFSSEDLYLRALICASMKVACMEYWIALKGAELAEEQEKERIQMDEIARELELIKRENENEIILEFPEAILTPQKKNFKREPSY